ncbi:MAG: aspartate/methionine/tyrosine aminotransferase [Bermanella sp.]|jgi:aspartate/methionine/tyrosine aminotransferase
MPGWRVGFCCGNPSLIAALARIKSYLDYGMFTPIQVAAIHALKSDAELRGKVAQSDHVCLGAIARSPPRYGLTGIQQKAAGGG